MYAVATNRTVVVLKGEIMHMRLCICRQSIYIEKQAFISEQVAPHKAWRTYYRMNGFCKYCMHLKMDIGLT